MRRMKRIGKLCLATTLERVAAAIKKTCDPALLGNAGLVPINDVDELPGIFAELNLQLALFIDH
jgi:hypothetical protein